MPYITNNNRLVTWSCNTVKQTYKLENDSKLQWRSVFVFTEKAKDGTKIVKIAKVTQNVFQRFFSAILPCHFATIIESKTLPHGCIKKKDFRAVAIKVGDYLRQGLNSFVSSIYNCFSLTDKAKLAAITIQKNWRGYLGRRKGEEVGLLSHVLFSKSKKYTLSKHKDKLEVVEMGRTSPQLLPGISTVLKASIDKKSLSSEVRMSKAHEVRRICREKGYKHLVVPEARLYHKAIIEKRLPIPSGLSANALIVEQLGFYKEKVDLFTDAVKEFAEFSFQYSLSDVVGNANFGIDELVEYDNGSFYRIPRYDNLPLYIDDTGKGKLGLIDLEGFNPKKTPNIYSKCVELIMLFPLHYNEIVSIGKKYGLKDTQISGLQAALKSAEQFMYQAYERHELWMKKHEIILEDPNRILKLTPEQLAKFSFPKAYSSFNQPKIISKLFDHFYLFLKETLEQKMKKRGHVTNYQQLVALRMIDNCLDNGSLNLDKYEKLIMEENRVTIFQARELLDCITEYLVENDLLIEDAEGQFYFF